MRLSNAGVAKWEYLDGPPDGWVDYSKNNQSFYSASELSKGNTLLCGIKRGDGTKMVAFLVRIGVSGNVIDERILTPANDGYPLGIRCLPWGDGVAVITTLAVLPKGIGWLIKLDADGNVLWERFGDQFISGDAMPATDGGLYLMSGTEAFKIDRDGNLLAHHGIPGSEQQFVHSPVATSDILVASMLSTLDTVVFGFDPELNGPKRTATIKNAGIKRCLELADGSLALFGSSFDGQATASVARIYKNGDVKNYLLEPKFQSGWFYDAVASGTGPDEFATVRQLNDSGKGAITWVSLK